MRFFRFAVMVIGAVTLAGCVRYEYRRIECPAPPPVGASATAWAATPGPTGSLVVHVATVEGRPPVAGASARLGSLPWRHFSLEGSVRFDSLPAGLHELTVRGIGYHPARTAIFMRTDSGVVARAVLAADRIVINESCGTMQRVPKPWWKVR